VKALSHKQRALVLLLLNDHPCILRHVSLQARLPRVHALQVVVTATGIEQLTTVPRDVERVEAICRGGFYDPSTGIVNAA